MTAEDAQNRLRGVERLGRPSGRFERIMHSRFRLRVSVLCALGLSATAVAGCAGSTKDKTSAAPTTPATSNPRATVTSAVSIGGCAGHAYVANLSDGTVSVITTATGVASTPITVGRRSEAVAITPDGAHAYVTNGNGTVSVITTATGVVSTTISVGSLPAWVAITPDGTYAYVTNFGDSTVSVITTASPTVTIRTEVPWVFLRYEPARTRVIGGGTSCVFPNGFPQSPLPEGAILVSQLEDGTSTSAPVQSSLLIVPGECTTPLLNPI